MTPSIYAQRRATLAAQLGATGVAIIPTALEQQRNRDSDFLFRHDSYFYYLTGFTEPKAWLVITGDGPHGPTTTLFCQPKDLEREIWDGIRLGPDAAPASLGVDAAFSVADIDAQLREHLLLGLLGHRRVAQIVARAVQADDQAIADKLVVAHALHVRDVLDTHLRHGRGGQEGEQQQEGSVQQGVSFPGR